MYRKIRSKVSTHIKGNFTCYKKYRVPFKKQNGYFTHSLTIKVIEEKYVIYFCRLTGNNLLWKHFWIRLSSLVLVSRIRGKMLYTFCKDISRIVYFLSYIRNCNNKRCTSEIIIINVIQDTYMYKIFLSFFETSYV